MQSKIRGGREHLPIEIIAFDHYPVCELNGLEVDNFTAYWTKLLESKFLSLEKKIEQG